MSKYRGLQDISTDGYCAQPNSVTTPVVCTDYSNCLGTDIFDYLGDYYNIWGFFLGCYDDYAYNDSTRNYYISTKVFNYYTETCNAGACKLGKFDLYRIIAQLSSDGAIVGCATSCEKIIYDN